MNETAVAAITAVATASLNMDLDLMGTSDEERGLSELNTRTSWKAEGLYLIVGWNSNCGSSPVAVEGEALKRLGDRC